MVLQSTMTSASAAIVLACPHMARELDEQQKGDEKCTWCIDRITDQPAGKSVSRLCVLACPTSARLFGSDVHDPDSEASIAIHETVVTS